MDSVPDPKDQVLKIDRLVQEVVRSGCDSDHPFLPLGQGGDDQDGNGSGSWILFQPSADFKSIHPGHHHIQQDGIGKAFRHPLEGLFSVLRLHNFEVPGLKGVPEQGAVLFIVIDDEDPPIGALGGGLGTR